MPSPLATRSGCEGRHRSSVPRPKGLIRASSLESGDRPLDDSYADGTRVAGHDFSELHRSESSGHEGRSRPARRGGKNVSLALRPVQLDRGIKLLLVINAGECRTVRERSRCARHIVEERGSVCKSGVVHECAYVSRCIVMVISSICPGGTYNASVMVTYPSFEIVMLYVPGMTPAIVKLPFVPV